MTKLFEGLRREKKYVAKSIILALVFWVLQYAYQFYFFEAGNDKTALIRSAAFTSATLIATALLTGPLARIFPSRNYVFHRRTLGVLGFTFGIVHVTAILAYVFAFDVLATIAILDPYTNPLIFGILAFLIYLPLYITSTDWATQKLGSRAWKSIHRLVYFAWILTVLHFLIINPATLDSPPGYLLMIVTELVFMFELTAFVKHVGRNKNRIGAVTGLIIIIFAAALFYQAYALKKSDFLLPLVAVFVIGAVVLTVITKLRKKPTPVQVQPQPSA